MNKITYRIRVDARNPELIWIDHRIAGTVIHTHGPFWSQWEAGNQIRKWEADEAAFKRQWKLPVPQGWAAV